MHSVSHIVRAVSLAGLGLAALALIAAMVLIGYAVFMRYLLNQPLPWVDELVGYLLVASIMLAAADTLLKGEHIAVDILTDRLRPRGRRVVLLGGLLAVAASAVLLIVEGADMVGFSRMVGLRSNGYLAVPMWLPQLMVPIGAVLMLLAAAVAWIDAWRGDVPPPDPGSTHHPPGIE